MEVSSISKHQPIPTYQPCPVLEMLKNPHYLYRLTVLNCITALGPTVGKDTIAQMILPVVAAYANDRVPNIKFNVAKTLASLAPQLDRPTVEAKIRPVLNDLTSDSDMDVKYFARKALMDIDK